ncbi:TetR/AcrR family transcriptional regulator [Petrocella sp. FN5]|uniref:TetR/AcrR family transcriptional regulator n=1 Tax=Petrocella sp. FN5 TaxID=3032002 RepID=UPI0023DA6E16|nr:TetR family transcriptional regulator [Petrocella sp. FN5]MDF1616298.1 TetR family transcriptional regulator [Petrocella sp. FN5]
MIKRKDKILISAIDLLYSEGVNGVTTKNLAKLEKVTEPALYRQYNNKQEILNHIVEAYAQYDERIINTIKESPLSGYDVIRYYIKRFIEFYENYVELTTVMFSMDLYYYHETTKTRMEEIVKKRISFLENLIRLNKETLLKNSRFNSEEMASMIHGTLFAQIYEWRMTGMHYSLKERVLDYVMKLLGNSNENEHIEEKDEERKEEM